MTEKLFTGTLNNNQNKNKTKIYDKRDDITCNFDIVNFPYLDGDVPRRPFYSVVFKLI